MTAFTGGVLHPLLVPVHVMALLALGLLIGVQMPRGRRLAPLGYAVALVAGLIAIALGAVPRLAGEALLALAAVTGLLVALARPIPRALGVAIAAATGLTLALDSPPEALSLREANLTLLGTACGAIALLFAIAEAAARLRRGWQRTGARILGSWIAASAILVLALLLAR
jgi:urease accessory protein